MKIRSGLFSAAVVLCLASLAYSEASGQVEPVLHGNHAMTSVSSVAVGTAATANPGAAAISLVQGSFGFYPLPAAGAQLPSTGVWTIATSPVLTPPSSCSAVNASCLEVVYSVAARKISCHWTVLFPAPLVVAGQSTPQAPTVVDEDANAGAYTMLVQLQTGMEHEILTSQAPVYPSNPAPLVWTGSVTLDIVVSPQGKVVSIPGVRGPVVLEPSAMQAVQQWVYVPLKLGSETVARAMTVQVNYSVAD